MSDPEPSVAAPSSSPPSVQVSESTTTPTTTTPPSAAAALNYAFLVHSQKTLTQNLPPRVDNKLLARQKRRRTSPEDHAILEAEYQRDPKPDKIARSRIVSRVSLGPKEVQIWFQNRRQNDRRKSKPLQPHELLAPRSDPLRETTGDENISGELGSSDGVEQPDDHDQDKEQNEDGVPPSSFESDAVAGDKDEPDQSLLSSQTTVASESLENIQLHANESSQVPESSLKHDGIHVDEPQPNSAKRKRSVADLRGDGPDGTRELQNLSSPPSLRLSLSFDGEAMVRKQGELTPSPHKGRNALRIAMSSDGEAVIRANGEPSPSKNRVSMFSSRRSRLGGLRRTSSAVVLGTPRAGMPEKERVFGRSRDPRNWESFFDTDARSALSTPSSSQNAPNAGSPGLHRSQSGRSLTRTLSARQNILASKTPNLSSPTVPQQSGEKRRKLARTVSSLGRLESARGALVDKVKTSKMFSSTKDDDKDLELELGDSDKENWIPGTRFSQVRRRAASHHSQRPVLKEANGREGKTNKNLATGKRSRLSQALPRKTTAKAMPDLGPEVSAFMAGGGGASQEEDLDCIQGLLSLSKGAWR